MAEDCRVRHKAGLVLKKMIQETKREGKKADTLFKEINDRGQLFDIVRIWHRFVPRL